MSVPHENPEVGVLVIFDADRRADLNSLFAWLDAGLLREPPERLEEGRFVATLSPAVHDVVGSPG